MRNSFQMCFPSGKRKAFTLSYDDGVEQDIRLIELMQRYGVKGTFNINAELFAPEGTAYPAGQVHRRMTQKQCLELYNQPGIEVATHGTKHGFFTHLPITDVVLQTAEDRKLLEEMFGKIIRGMAYPYGAFNDEIVNALRLCGIAYSRTTISTHNFDLPTNWLTLHPTCHHRDERLNELTDKFLNDTPGRAPWLFYVWGHAYEFEGSDNWYIIEEFLPRIANREDVWYATNIEIYEYVRAFEALIFSADGTMVTNPGTQDVYALIDNKTPICIPAGCVSMKLE